MANDPSLIPIRENQDTIKASWFNQFRQFLIDAFGAVTGQTSFSIANNTASPTNVGFSVDGAAFTSAKIQFEVSRVTSLNNKKEFGEMNLYYKDSIWYMLFGDSFGDNSLGDGFGFVISQAGSVAHIQYTSDNLAGTSYVGTMKLKANYFTI